MVVLVVTLEISDMAQLTAWARWERGNPVIHYLNPKTGLNVISSPSGEFISGWKLNPTQIKNVREHGGL